MRVPKIYIETTVFNFYFADDAPEEKRDTLRLFEEIKEGRYVPYASEYVLGELYLASEPKQSQMMGLIGKYGIQILELGDEAERLADTYIAEGVMTEKRLTDALHIAVATVHDLDFIVSYNFRHIVKRRTLTMTEGINIQMGYKRIGIHSPKEVIDDDE